MIGKILGSRYQIEASLGEGGMARVFKARDLKLHRVVAVKVLHDFLTGDQGFVRRFRREAQAIANLSHPSIVNVYDSGEEDNIYYIIMECLEGKTLKDLIQQQGRLSPEDAAEIACQVCDALAHAHKHNIVHKDIKPQNIVITDDGRVKVADFGIAQAPSTATITHGEEVMGSAYYFSPEQARGTIVGRQSDLYSLGIVLYEMLTGKVPFEGESHVSVAIKHLQENITPPRQIAPDIPFELERITLRAVQKDQSFRYQDADSFLDDLESWLLKGSSSERNNNSSKNNRLPQNTNDGSKRIRGKIAMPNYRTLLIPALAVLFVILLIFGINWFRGLFAVSEIQVPDLEELSLAEAEAILEEEGLRLEEDARVHHESIPEDHIVSQSPPAGRMVAEDRAISVVVSMGPELVDVPSLVGRTRLEANLLLNDLGLQLEIEEEYDEEVPVGEIISQDPREGFPLKPGDTVIVTISQGGRPFPLRDLTGLDLETAREWISLNNLILRNLDEEPSSEDPGRVIEQHPEPGEKLKAGDTVDLTISEGPEEEDLPIIDVYVQPAGVAPGSSIKVIIEDAQGERVLYEGPYEGGSISGKGIGSGRVYLEELVDGEYVVIDSWDFP